MTPPKSRCRSSHDRPTPRKIRGGRTPRRRKPTPTGRVGLHAVKDARHHPNPSLAPACRISQIMAAGCWPSPVPSPALAMRRYGSARLHGARWTVLAPDYYALSCFAPRTGGAAGGKMAGERVCGQRKRRHRRGHRASQPRGVRVRSTSKLPRPPAPLALPLLAPSRPSHLSRPGACWTCRLAPPP